MRRLRWPTHAEDKRQETQALADENAKLTKQADAAIERGDLAEARRLIALITANSERAGRLMSEAKNPGRSDQ